MPNIIFRGSLQSHIRSLTRYMLAFTAVKTSWPRLFFCKTIFPPPLFSSRVLLAWKKSRYITLASRRLFGKKSSRRDILRVTTRTALFERFTQKLKRFHLDQMKRSLECKQLVFGVRSLNAIKRKLPFATARPCR